MNNHQLIVKIKQFIAQDNLELALSTLIERFQNHTEIDHLILQSGRYKSLRKDYQKGFVGYEAYRKVLNQLRADLLDFVKDLPSYSDDRSSTENQDNEQLVMDDYALSAARVGVLKALHSLDYSAQITEIYQLSGIQQRKWVVGVLNELLENGYVEKEKEGKNAYWQLSEAGQSFAEKYKV
ncbi:MAG: hypothetical protein AAF960_11355 [Bacteroidota bacterium]